MRAILINPRTDKGGLLGRPLAGASGMVSALKGTHQAGQNITLMNMRGIRDKLQKVQLMISGCNENLSDIGKNLDKIDKTNTSIGEATSRLGDPWKQFLGHPVSEESLVRFIDVSTSLDKSREDLLGEVGYDPYALEFDAYTPVNDHVKSNALKLPRGGMALQQYIGMPWLIMQNMWDYYTTINVGPFIDAFGNRLPDGSYTALTYLQSFRGPGSFPDTLTAPNVWFYGPLYRYNDVDGVKTEISYIYSGIFNVVRPMLSHEYSHFYYATNHHSENAGWGKTNGNLLSCWASVGWTPINNPQGAEMPASWASTASFNVEGRGRFSYGNVGWAEAAKIYFKEGQEGRNYDWSYDALAAIDYIMYPDEIDERTGEVYSYVKMYNTGHFAQGLGGTVPAGYPAPNDDLIPCLGYKEPGLEVRNVFMASRDNNHSRVGSIIFARNKQMTTTQVPLTPKYNLNVRMSKFNGNTLAIPSEMIGGKQIAATVVWVTTGRFGDDPIIGADIPVTSQPKGTYSSVTVYGMTSSNEIFLLLERARVVYDAPVTGSSADVKSIENVIYNFDPWVDRGNLFSDEGKLYEVIATTYDGHVISYRKNAKWYDVFNELTVPRSWEFRKATFERF